IFFLPGISGSFFRPLALAYVLAIGASLLVALTVTPALALTLLPGAAAARAPAARGGGARPRLRGHRGRGAASRPGVPADLSRERLSHALDREARHLAGSRAAHHHPRRVGAPRHPRCPHLRRAHRPRGSGGRD